MQREGLEPLPIPEVADMCPLIAASILNRHGYEIPTPKANCLLGLFFDSIYYALLRKNRKLVMYEGTQRLSGAKLKIIRKDSDGILLLQNKLNPNIMHFIAFISDNKKTFFYDPVDGRLEVFKIKDIVSSVTEFDEDLERLFPEYNLVQISFIEPIAGGRRKTRKPKRKVKKTKRRN
jgi:hypothetical protein